MGNLTFWSPFKSAWRETWALVKRRVLATLASAIVGAIGGGFLAVWRGDIAGAGQVITGGLGAVAGIAVLAAIAYLVNLWLAPYRLTNARVNELAAKPPPEADLAPLRDLVDLVLTPLIGSMGASEQLNELEQIGIPAMPPKEYFDQGSDLTDVDREEKLDNVTNAIRRAADTLWGLRDNNDFQTSLDESEAKIRGDAEYLTILQGECWPSGQTKQRWHILNARREVLLTAIETYRRQLTGRVQLHARELERELASLRKRLRQD